VFSFSIWKLHRMNTSSRRMLVLFGGLRPLFVCVSSRDIAADDVNADVPGAPFFGGASKPCFSRLFGCNVDVFLVHKMRLLTM
jgi:hypothetical protein